MLTRTQKLNLRYLALMALGLASWLAIFFLAWVILPVRCGFLPFAGAAAVVSGTIFFVTLYTQSLRVWWAGWWATCSRDIAEGGKGTVDFVEGRSPYDDL